MTRSTRKTTAARPRLPEPPRPLATDIVREADPDGHVVRHHRTVDSLGLMLRAGTITPAMYEAGQDFHATFTLAGLEPLRSAPLDRLPGGGHTAEPGTTRLHARRRVERALAALGGAESPAGSCVWHVVGGQASLRAWAQRRGWGGRPVPPSQAQGILVAALGVLAQHTGHAGPTPGRESDQGVTKTQQRGR